MTKLIADLKSLDNISKYHVDGLIVSDDRFSTYNDRCFTYEEIEQVVKYCKDNSIISILNIDKIIEEEELDDLYKTIDEYLKLDVDYYIYGDFAVLSYFKSKNLMNKLIYDPKTMITNYEEARIHHHLGSLVAVSNELTIDEISENVIIGNAVFEVYGHHQMFYSKRSLLSTYSNFKENDQKLDEKFLTLKEELRDDEYPIYESKHGTFVYIPYRYSMFRELLSLSDKLVMAKINSMFIDEKEVIKIIDIYRNLIDGNYNNIDEEYQKLKEIYPNIKGGFIENKSILLKEEE